MLNQTEAWRFRWEFHVCGLSRKANARKTSQVNAGREATQPNGKSKTHDTSNRLRRIQNDGIRVWAVNQLLRV